MIIKVLFCVLWCLVSFWVFLSLIDELQDTLLVLKQGLSKLSSYPKKIQDKMNYLEKIKKHICVKEGIPSNFSLIIVDGDSNMASCYQSPFTKYISFDEGLVSKLSHKELASILAHEIGHLKYSSFWKNLVFKLVVPLVSPVLLFLFIPFESLVIKDDLLSIAVAMGFGSQFFAMWILFWLKVGLASSNFLTRKEEVKCDVFSAKNIGIKAYLRQAQFINNDYLRKKSWDSFIYRTHPLWVERISAVKSALSSKK